MLKFYHNFIKTDFSKNVSCPVCLENLESLKKINVGLLALQCGHTICTKCYNNYNDQKCHICRNFIIFYTEILLTNFCCFNIKQINNQNNFFFTCGHLICLKCLKKRPKNHFFQTYKCHFCLDFFKTFRIYI